jgi:hypothetical protein
MTMTFAGADSDFEKLCYQPLGDLDSSLYCIAPDAWLRKYWLDMAIKSNQLEKVHSEDPPWSHHVWACAHSDQFGFTLVTSYSPGPNSGQVINATALTLKFRGTVAVKVQALLIDCGGRAADLDLSVLTKVLIQKARKDRTRDLKRERERGIENEVAWKLFSGQAGLVGFNRMAPVALLSCL